MCEVTRRNFDEIYNEIIENLRSASFLSIDCEFSGLFDDEIRLSLFDTPEKRFEKLQDSLRKFSIIQFGLSTFKYERTSNSFTVSTYDFYLKPATGIGNQLLTFHLATVGFLCRNKFDFNKLCNDGINYLNKSIESEILDKIEKETVFNEDDNEVIKKYCSEVSKWIGGGCEGGEMLLKLEDETTTFVCLLHQEVRKRFHNVWTYFQEDKVVKIRKVTTSERKSLSSDGGECLKKKFFDSILGFSKIMKEIEKLKKPIVGHNILLDLILIYQQFYNQSPVSYKQFKKAISDIFPAVFDTKKISFTLREFLSKENTWNTNILKDLYEYLNHGKGATLVMFSPLINHKNNEFLEQKNFHDAGFDSFCTGFCFLKMAHMFSLWDKKKNAFQFTSLQTSSTMLLGAVAPLKNKVNMSRGHVNYIVLDGRDPVSQSEMLCFQSKTSRPLNLSKVSEILVKYGSVDLKPLTKHKALMVVSNRKHAREILQRFQYDKEVKLTRYNFLIHSEIWKTVLRVTLITSVVLGAVFASSRGWSKTCP